MSLILIYQFIALEPSNDNLTSPELPEWFIRLGRHLSISVPVLIVLLWFGYVSYMPYKRPEAEKGVVFIFLSPSVSSPVLHAHTQYRFVEFIN